MTPTCPDILEDCFSLLLGALMESRNRRFVQAKQALATAMVNGAGIPRESIPAFRAAMFYCVLLVQYHEAPAKVTPEVRLKASELLDQCDASTATDSFAPLMFAVLTDLAENRRAIPFGERALTLAMANKGAIKQHQVVKSRRRVN